MTTNTKTKSSTRKGGASVRPSVSCAYPYADLHTPSRLYAAYGSNLSLDRLYQRCPDAVAVGTCILQGYRLIFRGVADIIPEAGASVPLGIYRISKTDELALDRYEGWRPDNVSGLYRKEVFPMNFPDTGDTEQCMFYAMNSRGISTPGESYFRVIEEGYQDWKLDVSPLYAALAHAEEVEAADRRAREQERMARVQKSGASLRETLRKSSLLEMTEEEWEAAYAREKQFREEQNARRYQVKMLYSDDAAPLANDDGGDGDPFADGTPIWADDPFTTRRLK